MHSQIALHALILAFRATAESLYPDKQLFEPEPGNTIADFRVHGKELINSTLEPRDSIYDPSTGIQTIIGDQLRVTKCYCVDQKSVEVFPPPNDLKPLYGHYYAFEYYNWHLNRTYTLQWDCARRGDVVVPWLTRNKDPTHIPNLGFAWVGSPCNAADDAAIPQCFVPWALSGKKMCRRFADGNHFCYRIKGNKSWYTFNDQKRRLPRHASEKMTEGPTTEVCTQLCQRVQPTVMKKINGGEVWEYEPMSMVKGIPKWDRLNVCPGYHESPFGISRYTDLDDMCDGCA